MQPAPLAEVETAPSALHVARNAAIDALQGAFRSAVRTLVLLLITAIGTYLLSLAFPSLLGGADGGEQVLDDEARSRGAEIDPSFFAGTAELTEPRPARGVKLTSYEARLLAYATPHHSIQERLDELSGMDELKAELQMGVVLPLQHPRSFFGGVSCLQPCRGVTLVGKPGTGKTMLARALAKEGKATLLSLTLSALENKYFGESSKLLSAAFTLASKLEPCIVFFDEVDGMMRERSPDEHESSYGFKTEFLQHMDRLQARCTKAVVVIGSTNNARALDPALKRRLPNVYHLQPPRTSAERLRILEHMLRSHEPAHAQQLSAEARALLGTGTDGMTGSDLRELYRAAATARLAAQLRGGDEDRADRPHSLRSALERGDAAADLERGVAPIDALQWAQALARVQQSRSDADLGFCTRKAERAGGASRDALAAEEIAKQLLGLGARNRGADAPAPQA